MRQRGDEVCNREELEALSKVGVVFRVEEDIGALLFKGDLAQGDRRAGQVLRKALHGSRIVAYSSTEPAISRRFASVG